MSIEVDNKRDNDWLNPLEPAVDQGVATAALRALKKPALQANPIDLVTKKHAVMWECIGVKINSAGGKIYRYRLKDEYRVFDSEAATKKRLEIFPAQEPGDNIKFSKELQRIGYGSFSNASDVYLDLPDLEAIVAGYEKLRETRPKCPPLRIISGKGIAGHIEFSRAYTLYDIYLSVGIEFVHDSIYHAARVLEMMISHPEEYLSAKGKIAGSVEKHIGILELSQKDETNQVTTLLGAFVDSIWAAHDIEDLARSTEETMEEMLDIWEGEGHQYYWMKTYNTPIDHQKAIDLWQTVFS